MKSKQEIEEDYREISQIQKKADKALQDINASLGKNFELLKNLGYEIPSGTTFKESVEKVFKKEYGSTPDEFSVSDLKPQDAICLALINAFYEETTREEEIEKKGFSPETKKLKPSIKQRVLKFVRKGLRI